MNENDNKNNINRLIAKKKLIRLDQRKSKNKINHTLCIRDTFNTKGNKVLKVKVCKILTGKYY